MDVLDGPPRGADAPQGPALPRGRGAAAETIAAIVAGLVDPDGSKATGTLLERSIPLLGARAAYLCVPETRPGAGTAVVPRQLRVSAQRGFSEAFVAELARGEERAGQLATAAARTLEPQWIEEQGAGAGADRRLLASAQARSLLAVPLVARGILHGVLVWAFATEAGGDPETLRLARATAGAAALGLASASAEAEHEELLLLATVCRAERAVLRRTTPESVARSALRWSLVLAHADAAAIHLDGGEPGWRLAGTEPACRRLSAVLETGAEKDPSRPWLLPGGGVASRAVPVDPGPPLELLAIPLRRSGRLVLARSAASPLPESVARALETFARTAAAALAHAQALQQLEHEAAERARTEAAARAGEAELSDRFERIPEAVLVVDGAQRILDANRAACELLGAPKAALHGHRLEEVEAIGVRLPVAAAGPAPGVHRLERATPDGLARPLECVIAPDPLRGRHLAVLRERTIAREPADPWHVALERSPAGAALVDMASRTVVRANPAFAKLHGTSPEAMAGSSLATLAVGGEADVARSVGAGKAGGIARWACRHRSGAAEFPAEGILADLGELAGRPLALLELHDATRVAPAPGARELHVTRRDRRESQAGFGTWELDLVSGALRTSPGAEALLEAAGASGSADPFRLLGGVAPEDREVLREALQAAIEEGSAADLDHAVLSGGTRRHVLHRIAVETDAGGRPIRLTGLVVELKAARRADDPALAALQGLRLVLEQLPVPVVAANAEGRIVVWNEAARTLFRGASFGDAGRPAGLRGWWAESGRRMRDEEWPLARAALRGEATTDARIVVETFDGSHRTFRASALPLADERGQPHGAVAVFENETERVGDVAAMQQLVAELARERAWLRAVIDASPTALLIVDGTGVLEANAAAAALSATGGQGPPALPQLESAAGERLGPDELPLRKALGGEQVGPIELAVRCAGGAARPVHLRAAPILGVGASTAAVVVLEDISAQKLVEQLRQEWTSVVTHELLQALTTLNLYAGILQRPASGLSPDALGRLEHVVASSRRIHRIVRDLHDATRIDGRRLEVELRPADLGALLPAAIERARPLTDPARVELFVDGRLPVVRADPERVEQVLSNLLANAAKYGREGSPVRVGARCVDGVIEVTVANEGEGVPSGEQARIFERFSRTALGRRARKTGLGLGLYICRGIVEAHGGRIGVESTPGATTTFRFTLPTAPAQPA